MRVSKRIIATVFSCFSPLFCSPRNSPLKLYQNSGQLTYNSINLHYKHYFNLEWQDISFLATL